MTDQVNEAVATLSERRQWVRHAAETYASANDDAKLRVLRKEEAALGLAIQSLQNAHPSRGVVDEAMVERIEAVRQEAIRVWEKEVGVLASMNRQEACRVGMRAALQAAALPAVPDRCCAACKGSGEVEALTPHASGDPQDAYMAPATCEVCDGNGGADPWMPVASVLPMTPGWYVGLNHGRVEPLRFDGAYWHHTRMTRDLAGPSHWRTFESIERPAMLAATPAQEA